MRKKRSVPSFLMIYGETKNKVVIRLDTTRQQSATHSGRTLRFSTYHPINRSSLLELSLRETLELFSQEALCHTVSSQSICSKRINSLRSTRPMSVHCAVALVSALPDHRTTVGATILGHRASTSDSEASLCSMELLHQKLRREGCKTPPLSHISSINLLVNPIPRPLPAII
jgi:hypothetical protein